MHSKDRTLIANLGFADPDKGNGIHDLACQYLVRDESVAKIVGACRQRWQTFKYEGCAYQLDSIGKIPTSLESPISKGEDQYKTTVGFADVMMFPELTYSVAGKSEEKCTVKRHLLIEVKVSPIPISDCLRQMKFYWEYKKFWPSGREGHYSGFQEMAIVTCYPIDTEDAKALTQAGIAHFTFGEEFQNYVRERKDRADVRGADSPVI